MSYENKITLFEAKLFHAEESCCLFSRTPKSHVLHKLLGAAEFQMCRRTGQTQLPPSPLETAAVGGGTFLWRPHCPWPLLLLCTAPSTALPAPASRPTQAPSAVCSSWWGLVGRQKVKVTGGPRPGIACCEPVLGWAGSVQELRVSAGAEVSRE